MTLINNILRSGHQFSDNESELAFRVRVFNVILIIGAIGYFSNAYLFSHTPAYSEFYFGTLNTIGGVLNLIGLFLLRKDKKFYQPLVIILLLFFETIITYTIFYQTGNDVRILWLTVTIIFSTILVGKLLQKAILIYTAITILLFLSLENFRETINAISIQESITISVILIVFTYLIQNKYLRDKEKLHQLNVQLTQHQHILEKLNKNLDAQVKIELEKNDEKDKILIHQSRLVQMGELLSMIAHQWRQPLATIGSATTAGLVNLELGDCVSNELERTLKHIEDNTKKLSQTISRFQTYFKPDEEITITTFKDIKSVIEEFFHGYFEDKSIKIECNVQDGVNLSTYKDELVNVIFNLVFNSYESLVRQDEKKKIIKITMQEEKDFFTFSVTDNGEPLRSEVKAHMFDPYFSTKEEKNGKGMGLYMAKMIIEKHCKGTITIDDNAFGVTATVKVPNLA